MNGIESFIAGLPKAELHLHIEGTLPVKFKQVFEAARGHGYRLTMHCDVDQADSVGHIWQCLDDIGVERIDPAYFGA